MDLKSFLSALENNDLLHDNNDRKEQKTTDPADPAVINNPDYRKQRKLMLEIKIRECGAKKILIKVNR